MLLLATAAAQVPRKAAGNRRSWTVTPRICMYATAHIVSFFCCLVKSEKLGKGDGIVKGWASIWDRLSMQVEREGHGRKIIVCLPLVKEQPYLPY